MKLFNLETEEREFIQNFQKLIHEYQELLGKEKLSLFLLSCVHNKVYEFSDHPAKATMAILLSSVNSLSNNTGVDVGNYMYTPEDIN